MHKSCSFDMHKLGNKNVDKLIVEKTLNKCATDVIYIFFINPSVF